MRFLARKGGEGAVRDGDIATLCEALVMARMAYAATGNPGDGGAILSLLGLGMALPETGAGADYMNFWKAEAIALASLLADRGCELCAQHLDEFVSSASPETAAWAKEVHLRRLPVTGLQAVSLRLLRASRSKERAPGAMSIVTCSQQYPVWGSSLVFGRRNIRRIWQGGVITLRPIAGTSTARRWT